MQSNIEKIKSNNGSIYYYGSVPVHHDPIPICIRQIQPRGLANSGDSVVEDYGLIIAGVVGTLLIILKKPGIIPQEIHETITGVLV